MKKLILTALLAASSVSTFAMPTKEQLKKAQPLVAELMAPLMATYKEAKSEQKAAAAAKVADSSAEFAKAAETEAAKFLLLKGAVTFYARGEQYDKAAETVTTLQREIKDVPPAVIAEITGKATAKISETTAPALYALYRSAKLQVRASEEAKSLAAKLKKVKSDALQRKYAEALAVSGDWKSAYAEFAKVKNAKLQAIVKDESSGHAKNAEAGEFWWTYEPAMEDAEDFFKSHAAAFYRKALAANEISGLKKNLIEQRIKDVKVDYMTAIPVRNTQELKRIELPIVGADAIVFIPCPAGTFTMGYDKEPTPFIQHQVTISRPFWMSEAPITIGQYCALMGPFEERFKPRGGVSPADGLRKLSEAMGGDRAAVSGILREEMQSYCKKIAERYYSLLPKDCIVRLPTDAEWAYAFSCGGKVKEPSYVAYLRGNKPPKSSVVGVSIDISKEYLKKNHVAFSAKDWMISALSPRYRVKTFPPNDWGFYDMVGLCWEYLADTVPPLEKGKEAWTKEGKKILSQQYMQLINSDNKDPIMIYDGSDAFSLGILCDFTQAKWQFKNNRQWDVGFRIVVGPDLVSEWRAKHGKK